MKLKFGKTNYGTVVEKQLQTSNDCCTMVGATFSEGFSGLYMIYSIFPQTRPDSKTGPTPSTERHLGVLSSTHRPLRRRSLMLIRDMRGTSKPLMSSSNQFIQFLANVNLCSRSRTLLSRLKFSAIFLRYLVPWPSTDIHAQFYGDRPREPLRRGS